MMADNGPPPPGMVFPQKITAENEEYVVDLEDNMQHGPDGYGLDDRGRCKRRKRCGQCGPCQVKENCMKCHFCVRKDVLKQTCIYRKCIYLRSKPKPYSRPHQSPQATSRLSPARESSQSSPAVKSPVGIVSPGLPFGDQGLAEPRPDNPFFPSQLPQTPHSQQLATLQNNGYSSPVPGMDRSQPLSGTVSGPSGNMNMQVNMAPQIPNNNNASSPLHKVNDQTSPLGLPPPVNSQPAAIPGIPQITSCGNIPQIPQIPPVVPAMSSVLPSMSSNSIPGIPPMPSIPTMPGMNDRGINDFRSPDQLSLHPHHHHHPHFPPVPPVHPHPHMPHREPNLFGEHSRVPHMNFSNPNHMDSFPRGPTDSSCMYHPGLQYSMPSHLQPSGPSFLSGAAEINPFRSNFLNSFPPGYSYPPDRYREGFGPLPFSRLGMSSSAGFPQYPTQGAGYGVGNSFSQQYSPYNSQHGCPKNGSCPPVSPSTDDVKVLQEGYKKSFKSDKSEVCDSELVLREDDAMSPSGEWEQMSPISNHPTLWHDQTQKHLERSSSVSSVGSRSSIWEPWKSPFWLGSRLDDVRSRTCSSRVSSDFECEVISVDDHQMNALIRSDGCNSIEIEFDNRSLCSTEDFSLRKSSAGGDLLSPARSSVSQTGNKASTIKRSLFHEDQDKCNQLTDRSACSDKHGAGQGGKKSTLNKITYFKEPVSVIQDLGEEGVLHLELPGSKVSVETVELTDELLKRSSDIAGLRKFISKKIVDDGCEQESR